MCGEPSASLHDLCVHICVRAAVHLCIRLRTCVVYICVYVLRTHVCKKKVLACWSKEMELVEGRLMRKKLSKLFWI